MTRFRTQKAAALLAFLALHPHHLHSREELAGLLWPDSVYDSGRVSLRQALAFLRRALEPPGSCALFQTQGYFSLGLVPDAFQTDVAIFEDALRHAARAASDTERAEWLNRAVQAYGGPLLPGFYDDWVLGERERLAEQFAEATRRLAELEHLLPVSAMKLPLPISATPALTSNLPRQLTPFFGRAAEVAALLAALQSPDVAVVTVTGPGGAGKTRFALEAAQHSTGSRIIEARFERIAFVPLASLSDATFILPAILDALDIPSARELPPAVQIAQALAGTPTLLVLDNFEPLVETGACLVADLLRHAPGVTALITSRRLLGIEGEHEFVLPSLPTPDKSELSARLLEFSSVQLFMNRAQAVRPDFQVTSHNAETIAALCAQLEGIPLALELVAAWAQTLTPAQMLRGLEHCFDLLQSHRRDIAPRHRTMRDTIDTSFRLLPEDLARIWLRLSVFRGGWTTDAAQAVCPKENMPVALAALREWSLIVSEQHPEEQREEHYEEMRFRMLETLREFAQEQQDEDEAQAAASSHAAYFAALAEQGEPEWDGPNMPVWRERIDAELENIRAALTWVLAPNGDAETGLRLAVALRAFWGARGLHIEGQRWLEALGTACPDAPIRLRAQALYTIAWLTIGNDDMATMQARSRESLRLFREANDLRGIVQALTQEASALIRQDALLPAQARLDEAQALCQESRERAGQAQILHLQAALYMRQGKFADAQPLLRQSITLYRALGDEMNVVAMLCHLGCWLCWRGFSDEAAPVLEEAIALSRIHGNKPNLGHALWGLGAVAKVQGDWKHAAALFGESLQISQEMGHSGCNPRWELADTLCRQRDWARAKPLLLENLRRCEDKTMERWYVARLARVAWAEGQWERAARLSGIAWSLPGRSALELCSVTPPDNLSRHRKFHPPLRSAILRAAWKAGHSLRREDALAEVIE